MLRSRLFWKLCAGYVALAVLTAFVVASLAARRIDDDWLRDAETSLRSQACLLRDLAAGFLLQGDGAGLAEAVRRLGKEGGAQLTVIGPEGAVLGDSEGGPNAAQSQAGLPEIEAARRRGTGTHTTGARPAGAGTISVATRIEDGGAILGFARAAMPLAALEERLARVRNQGLLAGAASAVAGLLLGLLLGGRVVRALATLVRTAASVAPEEPIEEGDEIARLEVAFNQAIRSMGDRVESLARERDQIRAILAGMLDGVVAVDREQRIVHMNEVAGRMLRVSPDRSLGKSLWDVSRVPAVLGDLSGTLEPGVAQAREIHLPGAPKERLVEVRASALRDAQERPVGYVIVLHDITELRRLEQVRQDFVANVSHELKTPLTAIRGLVETLVDDPDMDAETHRRFLVKVRDQSARLSRIVTDLLTLARVESSEGALDREPLNLAETVQEAVRALAPLGESKGLAVETAIPDSPVMVGGDREALRQVVENLLDNAIKYTPEGGRVFVRLLLEAGEAVLEVEDTGPGIERQHLDRIFERFYRVDKARSREMGGTGLGLSIVKHVALAHGGQASAESTPGKGSTFRVRLPGN